MRSTGSFTSAMTRRTSVPNCPLSLPRQPEPGSEPSARRRFPHGRTAAEMHVAALEDTAPPSALVDERWNVVHLSPTASRFLQQSGGPLARRLTDLVRPELRDDLRLVLHRAVERPAPQLSPFVAVAFNGTPHRVAVLATQRQGDSQAGVRVLVTFLDGGEFPRETTVTDHEPGEDTIRELRDRLRQAERRIETMRDDHFLTNEDLRAANEELQSLNEEYRSTTEELETSKEELQSINEELQTVNNELKLKLDDVSRTHADLEISSRRLTSRCCFWIARCGSSASRRSSRRSSTSRHATPTVRSVTSRTRSTMRPFTPMRSSCCATRHDQSNERSEVRPASRSSSG